MLQATWQCRRRQNGFRKTSSSKIVDIGVGRADQGPRAIASRCVNDALLTTHEKHVQCAVCRSNAKYAKYQASEQRQCVGVRV